MVQLHRLRQSLQTRTRKIKKRSKSNITAAAHKHKLSQNGTGAVPKGSRTKYCILHCKYNGMETAATELLRCGIMHWVHPVCAGDSQEDAAHQGAWTCAQCRQMPLHMSQLLADLTKLRNDVAKTQKSLNSLGTSNRDLVKQLALKIAQCDELKHENAGLKQRVIKAETLNTASMNKLATNASNLTDWLIGNSLLRNVALDNLPRNTKVESLCGASISKAHSFITKTI